jgi:hypothetical protein
VGPAHSIAEADALIHNDEDEDYRRGEESPDMTLSALSGAEPGGGITGAG